MITFKPGELRLKISYKRTSMATDGYSRTDTTVSSDKIPLTINAEAGHLYAMKYAVTEDSWYPWFEEVTKGE